MEQIPNNIHLFFSQLGLSKEEVKIYLALIQRGVLTTLEISRATNVSRTQVYRLLEKMKKKGLVEELIDEYRLMTKAAEVDQLKRLIEKKEKKIEQLHKLFPEIKALLSAQVGKSQPETKVLFYRGKSGLQQMVWNNLRAEKECVGYTYRRIDEFIGESFIRDWKDAFIDKQLVFRHVYSDYYLSSLKKIKSDLIFTKSVFKARYISSNILDVHLQMDIYNDVVAFYNWHEGEVFGVEIYNRKIAQFQKQMFEIIWRRAKEIKI